MVMKLIFVFICASLNSVTSVFQCPGDGHFINPADKHSYYQCAHGTPFLMQCPASLVWNQQGQICDWNTPAPSTDCNNKNPTNCRETTRWTTGGTIIVGIDKQFGSDASHVGSPFGIFVDGEHGNVYVAETENHRIQKFNFKAVGSLGVTVAGGNNAGNASNQLSWPSAVYVDKNENVYISDTDNSRIQMWAKGATSGVTVAGGNGKGTALNQIGACQGLFVHEETNALFISDFYNDRIVKWIPEKGEGMIVAGTGSGGPKADQLSGPRGIFIDKCETIYIADLWNNRIQKWEKNATQGITVAGGNGKGVADNQLNSPWDVEVDRYGNIYVADTDNSRIVKWGPNSTVGVQLATGNAPTTGRGPFSDVYSIGFDKEGNLFTSEKRNNRIQQFNIMPETNTC
ncbi:unnamed protein product [Rotaria magnacalcarata]|uniref:Chitin-binding type-2 domain-containing protein n=8 Tax=Rotaria magnacalcarata TaxID=392030 RepID=A0A817AXC8_9BILA|nr:unnamed protein product [Rotaria magnacalcarata]CAF4080025.1 unnamed protein product [Rotaria magnacalcarata]